MNSITICGGFDKNGNPENSKVTLKRGETVCIVGPTGAGKSQLLEDIESLAQCDTPSKRKILIDGNVPSEELKYEFQGKLTASLSQNMNFIMDLSVKEFLKMHMECCGLNDKSLIELIIFEANKLTGEKISLYSNLTSLSGGQSRALMIADTALMSEAPVILIDELENAGVYKDSAVNLLVKKDKLVLISTHDPALALMGNKRLVINNGSISKIIETSEKERKNRNFINSYDKKILELREMIRNGNEIFFDLKKFLNEGEN